MPPAKKRKITEKSKVQDGVPVDGTAVLKSQDPQPVDEELEVEPSEDTQPDASSIDKNQERKERFKALQARAVGLLSPAISGCASTYLSVAKICSEESQGSSRRVTTTSDRP